VVRQRYAKEVGRQVEEKLTSESISEAFQEHEIRPLGYPRVEAPDPEEGQPFSFLLRYEVSPTIEPTSYLEQEVARPEVEVTDEDVKEEMEKFRRASAFLVPVEGRGAEEGDVVSVDLAGEDPVTGEALRHEGVSLALGAEGSLPEFDAGLRGKAKGESTEFDVRYPDDFRTESLRGKTVHYQVEVKDLRRQEIPELDDEFAKDAGEFESLEEMREAVRQRLTTVREAEADRVARDRLLGKISDAHDFEVPESLVEGQLDGRMEELAYSLLMQGIDPRKEKIDWRSIRDEQRDKARAQVKQLLLLDAIIEKEGLELTREELDERIEAAARAHKERPEVYRNKLKKEKNYEAFKNQALRQKCLDFVYATAKIS
jgi:trigger factor